MKPPKTRKTAALREDCLAAAARLFARKGYAGTKLQDIADEVGISRTAFYYYFSSKEELLGALTDEITVTVQRQSEATEERGDLSAPEMLRTAVQDYARWLLDHPIEFRMVDRLESDFPPELGAAHHAAKRRLLASFARIIERGRASGHFRTAEPRMAAFAIIGMCNWGAWWFKPGGAKTSAEVAAIMARFALGIVDVDEAAASGRSQADRIGDAVGALKSDLARLEELIGST